MSRLPTEIRINDHVAIPSAEIDLAYARSGGPGGQHVNRTASKVQLRWNLRASRALTEQQRAWLGHRLASRLTTDGDLIVSSERHRDQSRNVDDAVERFAGLLREGLKRPKRRKKTRPSRASKERRLQDKKKRGEQKRQRRDPGYGSG